MSQTPEELLKDNKVSELMKDWPVTNKGRLICSKDKPMPMPFIKGLGAWEHDNVIEIDCSCDCCARYQCTSCGYTWKEELPL